MATSITTVAFEGIRAVPVDVQVQISPGMPRFNIVGLPDKAVGESRERVRAALIASGLALPARHISVNLAPADLPKEGSHYDLPIALGLMAAMGAIPSDMLERYLVLANWHSMAASRAFPAFCRPPLPPMARTRASSALPLADRKRHGREGRSTSLPLRAFLPSSITLPAGRSPRAPCRKRRCQTNPARISPT